MDELSDYEKRRAQNIAENKKVLAELGFDKPFILPRVNIPKRQRKRKRSETVERPRKQQAVWTPILEENDDGRPMTRRSARLSGKTPHNYHGLEYVKVEENRVKNPSAKKENVFGHIEGVEMGTTWLQRLDCSRDGVHRPTVSGIHYNTRDGCFSIALSGGYEDDVDYGECFTYTGSGGRDLKGTKANPKNLRTAPQTKDQTLTKGNYALTVNIDKGIPVRVIRGYKLKGPFAPEEGYRYDGLYTVEKYWPAIGLGGFLVYKYALTRCKDQPPPPWEANGLKNNNQEDSPDSECQVP